MLNDIYTLLPQDIIDFNNLNALPKNSKGPQVTPMSYKNAANESSAKMTLSGTPAALIPAGFQFSDVLGLNVWEISTPFILGTNGEIIDVRAKCRTDGEIVAVAGTLTSKITTDPHITSLTNPNNAIISGAVYDNCVDKKTIDDPRYQQWADAMESNQSIETRQVITITMSS